MKIEQRETSVSLSGVGLTDEDIYEAMKALPGYVDITPGDFKELYCIAYKHAMERFARSVPAGDIMTREVLSVTPDTSIAEIAEILSNNRVSGLPVVDSQGLVIGVVSEKDILSRLGFEDSENFMSIIARCLRMGGCISLPARIPTAREIMTSPAVTVREDAYLLEVIKLLSENEINRLPVIDTKGRLVGIVARSDILNATLRSGTCPWNTSGR